MIHAADASVEVVTDASPALLLSLIAHDHADAAQRTNVVASISALHDLIALHAVIGAHLRARGVQL